MKTFPRLVGVVVVLAACGPARSADPPKPLSEADLLKWIEVKIPDNVIVDRVNAIGVNFAADKAILDRLKKAGASKEVLAAVGKVAKPAERVLSLMVQRDYGWDCPLHSELSINGKSVGTFTSDTDRPIAEYLRVGWNTITLKTTAAGTAGKSNELIFRVGPVVKKGGKRTMGPVIWEFRNGTDWKQKDGKYTHRLGPDVKEVTLTYKLHFAGLEAEGRPTAAGDYVLSGTQDYGWNTPVTGTVFVNGQALNTFLGRERQVVITPYLKKGENVIKLVSNRVPDAITNNDVKFHVGGPAEYNVTRGRFELKPVAQFEAMTGWKRNDKTGQLVNQSKGDPDTIEREIKFTLDHEPGKK